MDYGLLGKQLNYSFSQEIHRALGDYSYELFPTRPEDFKAFMEKKEFKGLNVTIPYKKEVMPYCDALDSVAKEIGAVNTIYKKGRQWIGTNTDYAGFLHLLKKLNIILTGKKVLILGTGGASAMVQYAAKKQRAKEVVVAGRRGPVDYRHLPSDAQIIINTTPLGTYPRNEEQPVNLDQFSHVQGVVDLVYNPLATALVLQGKERGLPAGGGLPMLVAQAAHAAAFFTGDASLISQISPVEQQLTKKRTNVILIGMPGSGKTTVGETLAGLLSKKAVDIDKEIEKKEGQRPDQIIEKKGEKAFREIESQVVQEVGREHNQIIATGGGSILLEKNRNRLKQNGLIFLIRRPFHLLDRRGRPLTATWEDLQTLETIRKPIYESFADYHVENSSSPQECAQEIHARFEEHNF